MEELLKNHQALLGQIRYQQEVCERVQSLYTYNILEEMIYNLEKSTQLIHRHVTESKIEVKITM
jgi:DNA-binding ferritin-like protein